MVWTCRKGARSGVGMGLQGAGQAVQFWLPGQGRCPEGVIGGGEAGAERGRAGPHPSRTWPTVFRGPWETW